MKSLLIVLSLACFVAGCAPKEETPAVEAPQAVGDPKAAAAGEPPSDDSAPGGGIGIVSPAAGSLSPVTGSESLQGGGGGVGVAAKARAKDVAAQASATKEPPSDDSGY